MNQRGQLRSIYEGASGASKLHAAIGLAAAGDSQIVPFLLDREIDDIHSPMRLVRDRRYRENYCAIYYVECMGEKMLDALYDELTGPESNRRRNAWRVLDTVLILDLVDSKRKKALLDRLLEHPDSAVQAEAMKLRTD